MNRKDPIAYAKASCDTMMKKFKAEELPPTAAFHQYGKIIMRGGMPPVPNRNGKSGRAGGFPCGRF